MELSHCGTTAAHQDLSLPYNAQIKASWYMPSISFPRVPNAALTFALSSNYEILDKSIFFVSRVINVNLLGEADKIGNLKSFNNSQA